MAVPKRHLSKARRDKRRSNVWKLDGPRTGEVQQLRLSEASPTRHVATGGYYKGEEVIKKA